MLKFLHSAAVWSGLLEGDHRLPCGDRAKIRILLDSGMSPDRVADYCRCRKEDVEELERLGA